MPPVRAAGLSFSLRTSENAGNSNGQALAEYYSIANSPLSDIITSKISGTAVDMDCLVFGISGADTSSPFDSKTALPSRGSSGSTQVTSLSVPISTSNANDMLLVFGNI